MAYIGIKSENALYYFSSLRMRDDIASHIPEADLYLDSGKEKALKEYNLTEADIQDGRILIDKFYFDIKPFYYLGVKGTPFEGVYYFKTETVRDRVSKDFSNCVISNRKSIILSEFGLSEDKIQDGGILMSKDAVSYLKCHRPSVKNRKIVNLDEGSSVSSTIKSDISIDDSVNSVDTSNESNNVVEVIESKSSNSSKKTKIEDEVNVGSNFLQSAIQRVVGSQPSNDIICIRMIDGSEYYVTLRHIFHIVDESMMQKCGYIDESGKPQIREEVVERMLERGDIFIVTPSQIYYGSNGVVRIKNCDDAYSPDITHMPSGKCEVNHHFDDIILNGNQVVSVIGYPYFKDIVAPVITRDYKMLYTYLKNKVKKGI